jgi:hypothetical protein
MALELFLESNKPEVIQSLINQGMSPTMHSEKFAGTPFSMRVRQKNIKIVKIMAPYVGNFYMENPDDYDDLIEQLLETESRSITKILIEYDIIKPTLDLYEDAEGSSIQSVIKKYLNPSDLEQVEYKKKLKTALNAKNTKSLKISAYKKVVKDIYVRKMYSLLDGDIKTDSILENILLDELKSIVDEINEYNRKGT